MMDPNRMKVLEMVAAGRITVAQAEKLLDRLKASKLQSADTRTASRSAASPQRAMVPAPHPPARPRSSGNARFLRVVVNSAEGDRVNVRVPMALVRTGVKLSALLPEDARVRLEKRGVDFGKMKDLQPDQLVEALCDLTLDVDSAEGDVVRIFCE